MELLTETQHDTLIDNGRRQQHVKGTAAEIDFEPVVKLFTPDGAATWLLTELDPEDTDIAWGLCDLGFGCPEFGTVRISELAAVRGVTGLAIERDLYWQTKGPISAYIDAASAAGHIVQLPKPARRSVPDEKQRRCGMKANIFRTKRSELPTRCNIIVDNLFDVLLVRQLEGLSIYVNALDSGQSLTETWATDSEAIAEDQQAPPMKRPFLTTSWSSHTT